MVYKASLTESPNTFYAAKFIKEGTVSDGDFRRETGLMKKLNDPNVIQLIG